MNDTISLLDLEDSNIEIESISIDGRIKTVTLITHPQIRFCPICGYRMHSRGIRPRRISHPIIQDTYALVIILKQRRWRCTNETCRYEENESFNFVRERRRSTNAADLLIVEGFKDLSMTAVDIARKFNTSDTHVLEVFDHYVDMKRLPLSDAISVDEVYLNIDQDCKYVLVIQDFHTGEPIDILKSRKQSITEPYFASIPKEERFAVRYLISDMNNEYIRYVDRYFPNAVPVIDSFHVIQWIGMELEQYLRDLQKTIEERDRKRQEEHSAQLGKKVILPVSDELYMLKNYRFFLLSSASSIIYHEEPHLDRHFRYLMRTADYRAKFFAVDPSLEILHDLKERYIRFNTNNAGKPQKAAYELDELIQLYERCDQDIFVRFSKLLKKYREPIINSFILVERTDRNGNVMSSRLSNGPIESLNRKVKDLKRLGRGYRNFEHLRNRFLYAARFDPELNGRAPEKKDGPRPIRFRSDVPKNRQRILIVQYESLLEKYECSKDELLALRHWVAEGNSPYDNPDDIRGDAGLVCDFIAATRILDEAFAEGPFPGEGDQR